MSFATLRSGPSALRATWQVAVAASSGSEDADGEELVEPPEPEATEPPSRRAAIRRLDGRRFSGAQAACACGTMRASVCATAEVLVARQHAVSEPHRSPVCTAVDGEEVAGSHAWAAWCGSVLSSCSGLRRRRAACWRSVGGKSSARSCTPAGDPGVDWGVLCARRGVVGDVPGLWRGRRHARITQGRHVGELEPELYFLGVGS